jgi:hypothetical protein
VRSDKAYLVLSPVLRRAARRIKQGKQNPQWPVPKPSHRPFVGDAHESDLGASFASKAGFLQPAAISPLVLSQ